MADETEPYLLSQWLLRQRAREIQEFREWFESAPETDRQGLAEQLTEMFRLDPGEQRPGSRRRRLATGAGTVP